MHSTFIRRSWTLGLSMALLLLAGVNTLHAAVLFETDFSSEVSYGEDFFQDANSGASFPWVATGGLVNSHAVDLSTTTPSVYTTVDSFELSTSTDDILAVSTYFKFEGDGLDCCSVGEALLGFTAASSTSYGGSGNIADPGIGVIIYNTDSFQIRTGDSWWGGFEMPELVPGEWYKVVFAIESTDAEDIYNLHVQVWNSDEDGDIYSLRMWYTESNIEYAAIAENVDMPGSVHGYFGTWSNGDSYNFTTMDDFEVSDTPFAPLWSGAGTEGNPYIINSCAQLQAINNDPDTNAVRHFQIGNANIDCSDTVNWNGGQGFFPIGYDSKWGDFDGIFDGNDKVISGLTIDRPDYDYQALFAELDNAEIKDLTLEDVTVTGYEYVGSLAGYTYESVIQNVRGDGVTVTGGAAYTGGLVGYLQDSTLDRVGVSDIDVVGPEDLGGLVGYSEYSTTTHAYVIDGSVTMVEDDDVGGLIGNMYRGLVENSYTDVHVIGEASEAQLGGLVGDTDGSEEVIRNSFALGDVTAAGTYNIVGGLIGAEDGDNFILENSFASGGTLTAGGTPMGIGGLVGKWGDSATTTNNYFYNAAELACVGGGIEYFPEECASVDSADYLRTMSNQPLASWDVALSSNGSYNINSGYPVLAWQVGASGSTWLAFTTEEEEEEEEEEEPVRRTSSSGGKPRVTTPAPATTPAAPAAPGTSELMTQLRALIAQYVALGGTMTPALQAYLDGGSAGMPTTVRDLELGMEGEDVRALQTLLMAQGYSIPPGATAYFGTYTRDALAAYQAKYGIIPAIGYFGPTTRAQMKSAGLGGLWW